MSTQPEALRLADALMMGRAMIPQIDLPEAAAELRRLHEVNKKLIEENSKLWGWYHDAEQKIAVLQGRAKATGEQA